MSTITSSTSNSSSTSNPVSVASSSSAGAAGGSVINVSSLVSQLVAATEAPQQSLITSQTQAVSANVSAVATLKSALSSFQGALSSLSTAGAFNSVGANSSDQTIFTATAASGAVTGSYAVTVSNLASAQQLLSTGFIGGSSAVVGTGTLTLSLGSSSFNVNIDTSNDSLAGIAGAINSASGNPGINATVVTGTDGGHLVLSSSLTGAANTIQVTASGALSGLAYGGGNTGNYTQQSQAKDASFSVAGVAYTSASNSVSNALSGVTLNLLGKTAANTSATLTVSSDTSQVQANIQSFATAYNSLYATFSSLGGYDATTGSAGALMGNPVLTGIESQVQRAVYGLVGSGTYSSLASIGVTAQRDGTLSVNSATLTNALSSNFNAVSQLFSSSNGVAAQLNSMISSDLATTGVIGSYSQSLVSQENALTQKSTDLQNQTNALTASMTYQFSKLNSLLSSLQSTSSYLTQTFATLPTMRSVSNNG